MTLKVPFWVNVIGKPHRLVLTEVSLSTTKTSVVGGTASAGAANASGRTMKASARNHLRIRLLLSVECVSKEGRPTESTAARTAETKKGQKPRTCPPKEHRSLPILSLLVRGRCSQPHRAMS